MGEAARPPVSMTTADGDSQTDDDPERLSIPFGPLVYLSVLPSLLTLLHHVVIGLTLAAPFIRAVKMFLNCALETFTCAEIRLRAGRLSSLVFY